MTTNLLLDGPQQVGSPSQGSLESRETVTGQFQQASGLFCTSILYSVQPRSGADAGDTGCWQCLRFWRDAVSIHVATLVSTGIRGHLRPQGCLSRCTTGLQCRPSRHWSTGFPVTAVSEMLTCKQIFGFEGPGSTSTLLRAPQTWGHLRKARTLLPSRHFGIQLQSGVSGQLGSREVQVS